MSLSRDFSDNKNGKLLLSVTLRMALTNEDGRMAEIMKWYDSAVIIDIILSIYFLKHIFE